MRSANLTLIIQRKFSRRKPENFGRAIPGGTGAVPSAFHRTISQIMPNDTDKPTLLWLGSVIPVSSTTIILFPPRPRGTCLRTSISSRFEPLFPRPRPLTLEPARPAMPFLSVDRTLPSICTSLLATCSAVRATESTIPAAALAFGSTSLRVRDTCQSVREIGQTVRVATTSVFRDLVRGDHRRDQRNCKSSESARRLSGCTQSCKSRGLNAIAATSSRIPGRALACRPIAVRPPVPRCHLHESA